MKILLLAAALFSALSAAPASPGEKTDLQELFRSLDRVIARSGEYTARRESRIDSLKRAVFVKQAAMVEHMSGGITRDKMDVDYSRETVL